MWVHWQTAALEKVSTETPVQEGNSNSISVKLMAIGL